MLEIRVLGPLEVEAGGRLVPVPRGHAQVLLVDLALHAGTTLSAGRLVDDIWGSAPPRTAAKALQVLVWDLRRRLDAQPAQAAGALATRADGYLLDLGLRSVDALGFRALAERGLACSPSRPGLAGRLLRRAERLWRGAALAGVADVPALTGHAAALEDLRLMCRERRVALDLHGGRTAEVVAQLEDLVAEHPFRERLWELLVLALYRQGRRAEALERYHEVRSVLAAELGVEPGPGLGRLERAIRTHDRRVEHAPRVGPSLWPADRAAPPPVAARRRPSGRPGAR